MTEEEYQFRQKQENEAIERMEILKIFPEALWEFSEEGRVVCCSKENGRLYYLTPEEEKMVEKIEENTGNLVYHLIKTEKTGLGTMYSFLYVSPDEENWAFEKRELEIGLTTARIKGADKEKTGFIGIKPVAGGLIQTW